MPTDDEKKAAAAKERDTINATVVKAEESEVEEKEVEVKEEPVEEKEVEVVATDEAVEEVEDKIDELKDEKKEAKTQADKDRIQRRIDREVAKRKALEDEVKTLRAQLAAKPDDEKTLTEDDVETRANRKALELKAQEDFVRDCNKLAKDATKLDTNFKKKVDAMAEDVGPIPSQMIGILSDLDNGGAVLNYLTDNVDEAEEIYALSPAKMGLRLAKIEEKLAKKPEKKISKVPNPIDPVGGKGTTPETLTGKESMDDFARIRAKQVEDRRKQRMMN